MCKDSISSCPSGSRCRQSSPPFPEPLTSASPPTQYDLQHPTAARPTSPAPAASCPSQLLDCQQECACSGSASPLTLVQSGPGPSNTPLLRLQPRPHLHTRAACQSLSSLTSLRHQESLNISLSLLEAFSFPKTPAGCAPSTGLLSASSLALLTSHTM